MYDMLCVILYYVAVMCCAVLHYDSLLLYSARSRANKSRNLGKTKLFHRLIVLRVTSARLQLHCAVYRDDVIALH